MNVSKTCLFGGALAAAGIANAQQFIYADMDVAGAYSSFAYSQAYAYGFDIAYAPDALNTYAQDYTYLTGTTTVWTTQDNTSMSANGNWDGGGVLGYGYGGNLMQQFFQVSADADLVMEWDVSGTDGYAQWVLFNDDSGAIIDSWDGLDPFGGAAGTSTIALQAGVNYGLVMGLQAGAFPFYFTTDTAFVSANLVPAPGAMGLLGVAGLAATRRRR
jgi:hypothetical protein